VLTADDRPGREERSAPNEWTDEEVEALLAASARLAARPVERYDYSPLLRLTATLGLRLGEALGLQWGDFEADESVLHVRRQWLASGEDGPPKTAAGVRRIALPRSVRDELILLRLASAFSGDGDPVFASRTGRALDHRGVSQGGFNAARDEAGLPRS
jgi:integrase